MARPGKGGRARHFGIDRWVDFARGLEPETESARMLAHAAECEPCRDMMNFFLKLNATAGLLPLAPPKLPSLKRNGDPGGA